MRWILVGAFAILFTVATVTVVVGGVLVLNTRETARQAKISADQSERAIAKLYTQDLRIDAVAEGQCERVQIERERSNVLEATVYRVLLTASQSAADPRARKEYREQAEATAYSPPANCARAVADPRHYRLPPTIPFTRLPPGLAEDIVHAARARQPQPVPKVNQSG